MRLTFTILSLTACVTARHNGFLKSKHHLQPDIVAQTLIRVQDEWQSQALMFAECDATRGTEDCMKSSKAFEQSCATVVGAVVKASDGDRAIVKEYFGDVCAESVLRGWQKDVCFNLASTVTHAMSADEYTNRQDFDLSNACHKFWTRFSTEERERMEKERSEREAEEKRQAEAKAEKERAEKEEAARKEKQRRELEAAEQKRKEAEEAKRREEEAKKIAQEAAAKKAEAEHAAAEAKKWMEEVKAVEEAKAKAKDAKESANKTQALKPANVTTLAVKTNTTEAVKK